MKASSVAISTKEAARRVRLSIRLVRDRVWSGQLPGEKVNMVWRIPVSTVEVRLKKRGVKKA
jgi:hypothetical protein